MKRVLLIDADILVYTVAASEEVPIDWGNDLWTLHSFLDKAILNFDARVQRIIETLKADHVVMALTTTARNFRKDILPTYKANRKDVRKPLVWKPLREHCAATYETFEREGLEGDDCLGILATRQHQSNDEERIICSIDKDFQCVPAKFFNINKPQLGIAEITEEQANRFHMIQTLTGDTTDGYKGCDGIGPKKAEAILEGTTDPVVMWSRVVAAFQKAGFGEEYALVQARVARILRASDYDFKTKKPILWEAPKA